MKSKKSLLARLGIVAGISIVTFLLATAYSVTANAFEPGVKSLNPNGVEYFAVSNTQVCKIFENITDELVGMALSGTDRAGLYEAVANHYKVEPNDALFLPGTLQIITQIEYQRTKKPDTFNDPHFKMAFSSAVFDVCMKINTFSKANAFPWIQSTTGGIQVRPKSEMELRAI